MRNDESLALVQHAIEVSLGHAVTNAHLNSLKQWVRLEEEKASGQPVPGVLICKNLVRELEEIRKTLPLHEVTDSTPVANPTAPKRAPRARRVESEPAQEPVEVADPVQVETDPDTVAETQDLVEDAPVLAEATAGQW